MLGCERANGLQLDDDPVVAHEVGDIALSQRLASIGQPKWLGGFERDTLSPELKSETLLVDRLQETGPHGVVDGENRPPNAERLIRVEQRIAGRTIHDDILDQSMNENKTGTYSRNPIREIGEIRGSNP